MNIRICVFWSVSGCHVFFCVAYSNIVTNICITKYICNYLYIYLYLYSMDRSIGAFYVAIIDNEVVVFDTNLKNLVEQFCKIEPLSRNYDWFFRHFKAHGPHFGYTFGEKEYFFQKLI